MAMELGLGIALNSVLRRYCGSEQPQPTVGYVYLTDTDGQLLTDIDGNFLMESFNG